MRKWLRWNERTRVLLTLELAICLPAAALIGVSMWKLKAMKRDRVVEAAIQRDFSHMLKISEKSIVEYTYQLVDKVREDFPVNDDSMPAKLDLALMRHSYAAHVFIYDMNKGFVLRSQPPRSGEADSHAESEKLANMFSEWMKIDGKDLYEKLRQNERKDGDRFYVYGEVVARGEKKKYRSTVFFTLPGWPAERVALGGMVFDPDFLADKFLPGMLNSICLENAAAGQTTKEQENKPIMMIHLRKESTPLAASMDWDGGEPEVERNFEAAFPGLTLAIKFRGTTIAALGERFVRTSFLIVGALSLFLAAGVWLTYRNVAREVALAKLKSDFVSNVSHELRTPLSLIRLYAETLEMGRVKSPEKYQEYYQIIRKESERLTALINNILDFARIEAGRKEYRFVETNLSELVRNTLDSYRYQIEQQGFTFEQQIADDVPAIRVDREAIARSLLNLVNNALKYSQGEKFLGIKLYRVNGTVKLEVIDRGIGIPAGEQSKIFQKFYRASDPLVHNTKGSGLGLSLVRHIVQAHGGQLLVESDPGRGSKFTMVLPVEVRGVPGGDLPSAGLEKIHTQGAREA